MFPDDNMASWTFCRWPHEHRSELGIESRFYAPSGPRLYALTNKKGLALRPLRMALYWYVVVLLRRIPQILGAIRSDVVLIQRGLLHPKSPPFLERILARFGPPIVYHLDDALWVLKPKHFRTRALLAEVVVTGSGPVADFARALEVPVATVEYPVQTSEYQPHKHRGGRPVVIGWTGTTPEEYLPPVAAGILEACRATGARFRVVGGSTRPELGELDAFTDWEPWMPDNKFTALEGADIGILPMEDTEPHRGKEPFKLKEYMAWGLPVVASPIGHTPKVLTDGQEGFYATTREEWTANLVNLIRDDDLRHRMGANGRRLVEERYDSWPQMRRLVAVLAQVAGRVNRD